jgi:hypothetical protein
MITCASALRYLSSFLLALAFAATLNAPIPETRFGVFRM